LGSQPFADLELKPNDTRLDPPFLLYLRVWERHVTSIEEPLLREIALGRTGPDTTTRTQIAWQVLVTDDAAVLGEVSDAASDEVIKKYFLDKWPGIVAGWQPAARGLMRAQAKSGDAQNTKPCVQSPESRFRGAENQLYRVEIHNSGAAGAGATYKWSRDNATVTFPIRERTGNKVAVETLGRDERRGLDIGDWVELVDDRTSREVFGPGVQPENLHQITQIDPYDRTVTLKDLPKTDVGENSALHPLLRRWDSNALSIEDAIEPGWDDLEDGIQIQFAAAPAANFRRGDFWLVPARVETGDVFDWPQERTAVGQDDQPQALPPAGVDEAFAPLAYFRGAPLAGAEIVDLRCLFRNLCQLAE
jgi:hypothetical protein